MVDRLNVTDTVCQVSVCGQLLVSSQCRHCIHLIFIQFDDQSIHGTAQHNRLFESHLGAVRCNVMETDCYLHSFTHGNVEVRGAQIQDARATKFYTVSPNIYMGLT
jgi:hypothetical protein